MSIHDGDSLSVARSQLAQMLEVHPVPPPFLYGFKGPASDCNWFGVSFPDERRIGGGHVIAIRKSDGSVAYFGPDGGE